MNKPLKAYTWKNSPNQHPNVAEIKSLFSDFEKPIAANPASSAKNLSENFADGKVQGKSRPGRVARAGASCQGSVTDLRARAKKHSGEKGRMYHWCANMKSGRKQQQENQSLSEDYLEEKHSR
jgi:hypothetical protein